MLAVVRQDMIRILWPMSQPNDVLEMRRRSGPWVGRSTGSEGRWSQVVYGDGQQHREDVKRGLNNMATVMFLR